MAYYIDIFVELCRPMCIPCPLSSVCILNIYIIDNSQMNTLVTSPASPSRNLSPNQPNPSSRSHHRKSQNPSQINCVLFRITRPFHRSQTIETLALPRSITNIRKDRSPRTNHKTLQDESQERVCDKLMCSVHSVGWVVKRGRNGSVCGLGLGAAREAGTLRGRTFR